jgi:hypothetical protein
MYHLEKLESGHCTNAKLVIFSRAHMSYINQIFGDISVREIIQEIGSQINIKGKLVVLDADETFENSAHHIYQPGKTAKRLVCSVDEGYQNINVDINDNLCQSYSLMNYFKLPFDKTPSDKADIIQKYSKHVAMITMYRGLLENEEFVEKIISEIIQKENNELWTDTTDDKNEFYLIEKYRRIPKKIFENIERVLNIWEDYGWQYFVEDGKCLKNFIK